MLHLSTVDVVLDAVVNKKYRLFSRTLRGCVVRKLYNYKTKQAILVTPCVRAEIETVTERAKHRPTAFGPYNPDGWPKRHISTQQIAPP